MSILVKKIPKISILVKIFENIDFKENCRTISNLVRFVEKFRFFDKIVENFQFWSKFFKISILVKIYKILVFGQQFQ